MEWTKRKEPEKGDVKTVKKFLWFPVCVNRKCKWLETITVQYECDTDYYGYRVWRPVAFID